MEDVHEGRSCVSHVDRVVCRSHVDAKHYTSSREVDLCELARWSVATRVMYKQSEHKPYLKVFFSGRSTG